MAGAGDLAQVQSGSSRSELCNAAARRYHPATDRAGSANGRSAVRPATLAGRTMRWQPANPHDPATATAGRAWARQALLSLLHDTPSATLAETIDLLFTELISNAIRHGGGLREAQITSTGSVVRLTVRDESPNQPYVATHDLNRENGRGMRLVEAFAQGWGVRPGPSSRGKYVWADLSLKAA